MTTGAGVGSEGARRAGASCVAALVAASCVLGACATGGTRPPARGASAPVTFTYGFDFSSQEPDLPSRVPANRPGAVASARRVLASMAGLDADQSIFGFGVRKSPEPSPGVFDMSGIAARVAMIEQAHDAPVITLVAAPNWMKNGIGAGSNSLFNSPPTPGHYQDFAALAAHVASSFPQAKYFVVWSEVRGFWNPKTRRWDYQDYTRMYNDVYRAIKRVRPDAMVGGPYADMHAAPTPVRGQVSVLHGAWGYLDQGMLDALSYWLRHKAGADFIAVDGATAIAKSNDASLTDAVTAAGQYAAVDHWIRTQSKLPIWWMESHIQPAHGWTPQQAAAARIATLAVMSASGARVGMQWQPQDQAGWADQGLWTSTLVAGGGQPTPLARELPRVLPVLDHAPTLISGQPRGVLLARSGNRLLAVNTTNRPATAVAGGTRIALTPGQVVVRPTGP